MTQEKMPCSPKMLPKRAALAKQSDVGPAQGQSVLAQADGSPRRADLHGTQSRLVGPQVRREEVEDVVLARIDPGLERGPSDGRNGRDGGGQRFEAAAGRGGRPCGAASLRQSNFSVRR